LEQNCCRTSRYRLRHRVRLLLILVPRLIHRQLRLKKRRATTAAEERSVRLRGLTRLIFSLFDLRLHKVKVLLGHTVGSAGFAFFRLAFFRPLPPVVSIPNSE